MKAAENEARKELITMRMTVAEVMTTRVVPVTAATPFKEFAQALITGGISAVPVIDGDKLTRTCADCTGEAT
jgi:CBS domain-containing protein